MVDSGGLVECTFLSSYIYLGFIDLKLVVNSGLQEADDPFQ